MPLAAHRTLGSRCFTFPFLQFAAHLPNGDFVRFLRGLLTLPLASEYFPDLRLSNGRVVRLTDAGPIALGSDDSTALGTLRTGWRRSRRLPGDQRRAALLSLDRHRFPERIATLSREMAALRADGTLGTTMYDATARDLVPR
jgi:hypothetical protein